MPRHSPINRTPLPRRCRAVPLAFDAFFHRWHQPFLRYATMRLWHPDAAQNAVMETALRIQQDWTTILAQAPAATAFTILTDTVGAFLPPRDHPPSPIESALADLEARFPNKPNASGCATSSCCPTNQWPPSSDSTPTSPRTRPGRACATWTAHSTPANPPEGTVP
ncbi:hypothetical protein GXW82_44035 [Streptacidiphilus sp. 4-A2]|nr:hypothetical protein [Streptacidiphilus sp. 4-A2]